MKDGGDALKQSSIKEIKRENLRKEGNGWHSPAWSTASSVRGTHDPKPETLPTVIHHPRPPWP